MKTEYKYSGRVATTVCRNGHFGFLPACDECGAKTEALQLLTHATRLRVRIVGYTQRGDAKILDTDGRVEYWGEGEVYKVFCCPAVIDWALLVARLFDWKIETASARSHGMDAPGDAWGRASKLDLTKEQVKEIRSKL